MTVDGHVLTRLDAELDPLFELQYILIELDTLDDEQGAERLRDRFAMYVGMAVARNVISRDEADALLDAFRELYDVYGVTGAEDEYELRFKDLLGMLRRILIAKIIERAK